MWGVSIQVVASRFGERYKEYLLLQTKEHINADHLLLDGGKLTVTKKGKFLTDGIASDLFMLN
jgi:oxygen-independent coproporphyrinogen-3 oxidase